MQLSLQPSLRSSHIPLSLQNIQISIIASLDHKGSKMRRSAHESSNCWKEKMWAAISATFTIKLKCECFLSRAVPRSPCSRSAWGTSSSRSPSIAPPESVPFTTSKARAAIESTTSCFLPNTTKLPTSPSSATQGNSPLRPSEKFSRSTAS
jgi:hypothetical protein